LLSDDLLEELSERAGALDAAERLLHRIAQRPGADGRIQVNVCVHVADVVTRFTSRLEVIGGELLRTDRWAPRDAVAGVCATREAVDELTGYAVGGAPGGLL